MTFCPLVLFQKALHDDHETEIFKFIPITFNRDFSSTCRDNPKPHALIIKKELSTRLREVTKLPKSFQDILTIHSLRRL